MLRRRCGLGFRHDRPGSRVCAGRPGLPRPKILRRLDATQPRSCVQRSLLLRVLLSGRRPNVLPAPIPAVAPDFLWGIPSPVMVESPGVAHLRHLHGRRKLHTETRARCGLCLVDNPMLCPATATSLALLTGMARLARKLRGRTTALCPVRHHGRRRKRVGLTSAACRAVCRSAGHGPRGQQPALPSADSSARLSAGPSTSRPSERPARLPGSCTR